MKLWLDDNRPPWKHGRLGWEWAKSFDEAVQALMKGRVTEASLDHDLSERATLGQWDDEMTGYDLVLWMIEHNIWPRDCIHVHTLNSQGRKRMLDKLAFAPCRVDVVHLYG